MEAETIGLLCNFVSLFFCLYCPLWFLLFFQAQHQFNLNFNFKTSSRLLLDNFKTFLDFLTCFSLVEKYYQTIKPYQTGEGVIMPIENKKIISLETEDRFAWHHIQVCNCLKIYLRKLINIDHKGNLESKFLVRFPSDHLRRVHFRFIIFIFT